MFLARQAIFKLLVQNVPQKEHGNKCLTRACFIISLLSPTWASCSNDRYQEQRWCFAASLAQRAQADTRVVMLSCMVDLFV